MMERVKDLTKIKMCQGSVLIKIYLKNTKIVAPEQKTGPGALADYAEVVAVSSDVTDLKKGDIVLDFRTTDGFKIGEEQYAFVPRMNVKIAVDPENFDNTKKVNKSAILKKLN